MDRGEIGLMTLRSRGSDAAEASIPSECLEIAFASSLITALYAPDCAPGRNLAAERKSPVHNIERSARHG